MNYKSAKKHFVKFLNSNFDINEEKINHTFKVNTILFKYFNKSKIN